MSTSYVGTNDGYNSIKLVCTTGDESLSPPTLSTQGLSLSGVATITPHVEAADGVTQLTAGSILFYLYNGSSGFWNLCNDLILTVVGGAVGQSFAAIPVDGPLDRLDCRPKGLGTAVNIFLNTAAPRLK